MKRKKILKKTVLAATVLLLILCSVSTVYAEAQGWYCVRNKEHRQPTLDAQQKFIEEHGGFYVDKAHGESNPDKVVYLTFDAGYENGNIEKVLDVLHEKGVTGAFFILENLIVRNTDLVKRMADEGHTVCNHTLSHKDMTKIPSIDEFREETEGLEALYTGKTGYKMAKFYRPPEGRFDEKSMSYANELGYKTIFWSIAYADWDNNNQPSPQKAKKILLDNIHNGAVILLHPTSATNAAILSDLIDTLKADGYRFGDLYELTSVPKEGTS